MSKQRICLALAVSLTSAAFSQPIPAEAARFYARYPEAQFSPLFRESLETFLRVETAYKSGDYAAADRLLKSFWAKNPPGTEAWQAANFDRPAAPVNIGHPPCYYALRMLTECTAWKTSGKPAPASPATATLTILLVGQAHGVEPTTRAELEAGTGRQTERSIDDRLVAAGHRLIHESTWLFAEYVTAATEGSLQVRLNILPLPELKVETEARWDGRGFSGPTSDGWSRIWSAVPEEARRSTDWWWVLYPSAVPDQHPDFKTTEFVTGGMGVGPDGASPCFIIDDKWLTRRPPHLGQGEYTNVERRAYLPQWFQHEFFHHLFRIYPEHRLEVEGHDWFDLRKWPSDFEGRLEPDYYAEALKKRFKGSQPSLANRLLYAPPTAEVLARIKPESILGGYRHEPEQNGWHRGAITAQPDGKWRWTNSAGASWLLEPDLKNGRLLTGPDCPYYKDPSGRAFTLVLQRDEDGRHLPQVIGFSFNGAFYRLGP